MRASTYYRIADDYENAIYYMQESLKFIQERQRFYRTLASLYSEAGISILDSIDQVPAEEKQKNLEEAYYRFEKMIYYNRFNKDIPAILYSIALDYQTYEQSINLLTKLISYAPEGHDIAEINKLIANLETMKIR